MQKYKDTLKVGKYTSLLKVGASLGLKWASIKADKELRDRSNRILKGIAIALKKVGIEYSYLYEKEPYVGTLLYDLGLDEYLKNYVVRVYNIFKENNVKKIITVDPHTYHLLKTVYPEYIENYDLEIMHYLEILNEKREILKNEAGNKLSKKFVIHDPCTLSRKLNMITEPRQVAEAIGIKVIEPKHSGKYTRCCGGPIEYAYPEYSRKIAHERVSELIQYSKDIFTYCPICLLNLKEPAKELGAALYDLGELIYTVFF